MNHLLYAVRGLRKNPAFTLVAVASLALGIGANTAIFSVMDAIHLRALGAPHPDQLMLLGEGRMFGISEGVPEGEGHLFSVDFAKSLTAKTPAFAGVAWQSSVRADVRVRFGDPNSEFEPGMARLVSGSYFDVLGIGPAAGRVLDANDDGAPGTGPVAVISYALWDRRFNLDRSVMGRTMAVYGHVFTIVGVAAPGFKGIHTDESTDFWVPLSMVKQVQPWIEHSESPTAQFLHVFGRRKANVTPAAAQASTSVLYRQWVEALASGRPAVERPTDAGKLKVTLTPLELGISMFRERYSDPLWILAAVTGVVLLIACANLANLLLARGNGRRRELAVRLALGASRRRLIFDLLTESMLLSIAGGAFGVLLAWWGSQYLLSMVGRHDNPLSLEVDPNWHVLLFTLLVSGLTGVLFGVIPALRATKLDPGPSLKEGKGSVIGASRSLLSRGLLVSQVALALLLTSGAGLLIRTLANLESRDPGFRAERVYVVQFDTDSVTLEGDGAAQLYRRIAERARQTPGVVTASFSNTHFGGSRSVGDVRAEGVEPGGEVVNSDSLDVEGQYFATLGMRLMAGRTFGREDTRKSERVVLINETLARQLFHSTDAVGKRLYTGRAERTYSRVAGVVADAQYFNLRHKPKPMYFNDLDQTENYSDLMVRVAGDAKPVLDSIRQIVREENRNLVIAEINPLRDVIDRTVSREKLMARLGGFFAAVAMLLAAIGLYGILAYAVSQRTSEIGIRMALGAQPGNVLAMILKESLLLVAIGIGIGIGAALASGKWIESQLYGLAPRDPMTMAMAAALMLIVAMGASLLPARRAARLDPIVALRNE